MPAVVLRRPELPHRPLVIDVPVGEYVPEDYRLAGYDIDTNTSPEDALEEAAADVRASLEKDAAEVDDFVPQFPPNDPATAGDTPVLDPTPAPVPASQPRVNPTPNTDKSSTSNDDED